CMVRLTMCAVQILQCRRDSMSCTRWIMLAVMLGASGFQETVFAQVFVADPNFTNRFRATVDGTGGSNDSGYEEDEAQASVSDEPITDFLFEVDALVGRDDYGQSGFSIDGIHQ